MDSKLRAMVANEVRQGMERYMETYNERYVSAKELSEQFSMFTPEFVKRYGRLLPRARVSVTDADGTVHHSGWGYARNKIARMIADGSIENLANSI